MRDLVRSDGWAPIRRELGLQSFGVNAWSTAQSGGQLIPEHVEVTHEELYVVLDGHATFTVDGAVVDAPAGTLVAITDPAIVRSAVAAVDNTIILTVGGEPGAVFKPNSWETNRQVLPLFAEARFDEARDLLLADLDEYADPCFLLYNLACAEAQLGDLDAALHYLARALEIRPDLGRMAAEDVDLIPLRDHQRFGELCNPSGPRLRGRRSGRSPAE